MFQTSITIIIILAAAIIALIRFIRFFTTPLGKCGGCSQNGGGCSLEDLKKEMGEKKIQNSKLSPLRKVLNFGLKFISS